jgi:hypothetical protein
MTPELDRAERHAAVRDAARAWRRSGILDEAGAAAVAARYPDDRVRTGPVFRVLLFLFTVIAVAGIFGFAALLVANGSDRVLAGLAAVAGTALLVLTEVQIDTLRRRQGGTEAATCVMGLGFLLGAAAWWLWGMAGLTPHLALGMFCLLAAALSGAAAYRFGYPLAAAASTAALLVALALLPAGRLLWIALPLAVAPGLLRAGESVRLPPSHRSSATAALLVALAALYLAVHLGSWDARLFEVFAIRPDLGLMPRALPPSGSALSSLLRGLAAAATGILPLLILGTGIARRSLPMLLAGGAALAASLVTLVWYAHLGPDWLLLTGAGAAAMAAAVGLARFLDSGPDGERRGFTTAPLLADRERVALLEAGIAAVTVPAAAHSPAGAHGFEGGGGRGGGGGASGEF